MGETITEASDRFGGATCKVVVSEPCRETRDRSAQNHKSAPQNHERFTAVDRCADMFTSLGFGRLCWQPGRG